MKMSLLQVSGLEQSAHAFNAGRRGSPIGSVSKKKPAQASEVAMVVALRFGWWQVGGGRLYKTRTARQVYRVQSWARPAGSGDAGYIWRVDRGRDVSAAPPLPGCGCIRAETGNGQTAVRDGPLIRERPRVGLGLPSPRFLVDGVVRLALLSGGPWCGDRLTRLDMAAAVSVAWWPAHPGPPVREQAKEAGPLTYDVVAGSESQQKTNRAKTKASLFLFTHKQKPCAIVYSYQYEPITVSASESIALIWIRNTVSLLRFVQKNLEANILTHCDRSGSYSGVVLICIASN